MATKPAVASPPPDPLEKPSSVLDFVGKTPLVEIRTITRDLPSGVKVYAKMEGFNPGGSVKDRAALRMIQEGLRTGALRPGKTIIDSTSGNTGIALAMVGAILGYPVELVMPDNVSGERKKIIAAFGAKIVFSSGLEGSDGAIRLCRELYSEGRERYFKPDQYNNEANSLAHFENTGPEIWQQTGGKVTHFVAAIGTGGTIMGTGRFLKKQRKDIQVIAVEPDDAFHGLEGLKHMPSSIVPGIYHEEELDRKWSARTEDAYDMVYRLGREEGWVVGQSSGAAMLGALAVARELREGVVVTLFPDFGDRYLSTNLWIGWTKVPSPSPGAGRA
ncbi:MAG: PLP-dependent cysteine synthase family protein [Vicinamibacterales bacterium]